MVGEKTYQRLALQNVVEACECYRDGVPFFLKCRPTQFRASERAGKEGERFVRLVWDRFLQLCRLTFRDHADPELVACIRVYAKGEAGPAWTSLMCSVSSRKLQCRREHNARKEVGRANGS